MVGQTASINPAPFQHVSLFTGYAGFDLALRLAEIEIRTVLYVEIEKYCQEIIRQRIRDGLLDDAPIWPDVRTLDGRPLAGRVGILTAGFPCQPHSVAGKRKGSADERNLWPETLRIVREMGPRYVLLENVPGILANGYAGTVIGQLSEIGYDCLWGIVSAADAGANHLRKRWWVLAHPQGEQSGEIQQSGISPDTGAGGNMADSDKSGFQDFQRCPEITERPRLGAIDSTSWWDVEPPLGRVANGVAHRVDRLKALGNGIVPAVVAEFLRRLESAQ